jgi:hypothetical protein
MSPRLLLPALAALVLAGPAWADDLLPANRPIPEAIDHYIDARLADEKVKPAGPAADAALLRRLTLDLVGRIPTAAEASAYLASNDPAKKVKLVDRLMASPGYARHQVNEFDTMLSIVRGRRGGGSNLREYLGRAFKENRSWDRMFRDLVLADEKEPVQKGAAQFLKGRIKDLDRLTTDVSVLFFGVNISCAQCHDHPLVADWKQDHYYGLKSFFSRTYEAGPFLGERDVGLVQFKTTKAVTKTARLMFLTGKVVEDGAPKLTAAQIKALKEAEKKRPKRRKQPNTGKQPDPPKFSARLALANLALEPGQRDFFARSIVNRLFHRHFGLGLVSPIDQMHSANEPSHPELLAWLARDTAEHGYDLRRLTRGLVLSRAYARSSRWEGTRWPSQNLFAVARVRALTPAQLATSFRLALAAPEQLAGSLKPAELERRLEGYENSARGYADMVEQPRDDFQIGVGEALLFSNSPRVQNELKAAHGDRLLGRMAGCKTPEEAVDLAVRNVLSRPADAEEKQIMAAYLARRKDRLAEAHRQLVWALLCCAEFRFNS